MTPYFSDSDMTLYQGDAVEVLRDLPAGSVHMACTSPPFFGLRDYGTGAWEGGDEGCDHTPATQPGRAFVDGHGRTYDTNNQNWSKRDPSTFHQTCGKCGARRIDSQIGLESSPDEWAARLVDVFREARRVLRDDGTLWVECGDSYTSGGRDNYGPSKPDKNIVPHNASRPPQPDGLKPKDLIGQPWLLAFALRADGWYLRSCIIWSKPNAMPESVTDRPTTGHSYVFLFSKKPRYFYDAEALREPAEWARWGDQTVPKHEGPETASGWIPAKSKSQLHHEKHRHKENATLRNPDRNDGGGMTQGGFGSPHGARNSRTVWTIPTEPNALAICRVCDAYWQGGAPREHCGEPVVQHFAAFPRELVRRMILAGTSERGVCAECGAPWVREVETEYEHLATRSATAQNTRPESPVGGIGAQPVTLTKHVSTLGWRSSCECPADVLPAQILDCFSGSGTSLLVARSLGRHAIGVELNERYAAMTKARTHQLSVLG